MHEGNAEPRINKNMAISPRPQKILALTSVRFFAAFYVMLFHSFPRVSTPGFYRGVFQNLIGMGYIGVNFFFVLSGFILAIVYLKDKKPVNKRRFLVARFARIYPLYFAAMLLDTPHFLHVQLQIFHLSLRQAVVSFFVTAGLLQTWLSVGWLNPPGWSLSAEAFFYLLFPWLGAVVWKIRGKLVLPVSVLIYLAGLGVICGLNRVQSSDHVRFNPLPHVFVFVLGILLARLYVWTEESPERSRRLDSLSPWLLMVSVLATIAVPIFHLVTSEWLLQHGLLTPLFAVIVLACSSKNRVITMLFSHRWLILLGEASYGIYLMHVPVFSIFRASIVRYGMPVYLLYVATTIGLSIMSYYLLEIPARRWILEKEQVRGQESLVVSSLAQ